MAATALAIKLRCANWQQLAHMYERDLSKGRMFLKSQRPPPLGTEIKIDLTIPSGSTLTLDGRVARHVPAGARGPGIDLVLARLPQSAQWVIESALSSAGLPVKQDADRDAVSIPVEVDTGAATDSSGPESADEEAEAAHAELDLVQALEAELGALRRMNPFQVLGVGYGAGDDEIRAAFGELSKKYHPDRFARYESERARGVASEIFILVRDAYRKVGDPTARATTRAALQARANSVTAVNPAGGGGQAGGGQAGGGQASAGQASGSQAGGSRGSLAGGSLAGGSLAGGSLAGGGATVATPRASAPPAARAPATPAARAPASAPPVTPASRPPQPTPATAAVAPASVARQRQQTPVPPSQPPSAPSPLPLKAPPETFQPKVTFRTTGPQPVVRIPDAPAGAGGSVGGGLSAESLFGDIDENGLPMTQPAPAPLSSSDVGAPGGNDADRLLDAGRYEEAFRAFDAMARQSPTDRVARVGRELAQGFTKLANGDRSGAAVHFETALEVDPMNERAARELAAMRRAATESRRGLLGKLLGRKP